MDATTLNARQSWSKLPSNVGDLNSRRDGPFKAFSIVSRERHAQEVPSIEMTCHRVGRRGTLTSSA
jgi:hypothetical protein